MPPYWPRTLLSAHATTGSRTLLEAYARVEMRRQFVERPIEPITVDDLPF